MTESEAKLESDIIEAVMPASVPASVTTSHSESLPFFTGDSALDLSSNISSAGVGGG